jgi:hypothetical protein
VRGCWTWAADRATTPSRGVDAHVVDLRAPHDLPVGPFDAILSNFGVLNCVDIPLLAGPLAQRLRPGGALLAVVMSARCPAETATLIATGHPREAWRRRRRGTAPVGGRDIPVRFLSPRDVAAGLSPHFRPMSTRALGVVMPPPGRTGARFHRFARHLDRLDDRLGRLPLLNRWGDHVAVMLRAVDAP